MFVSFTKFICLYSTHECYNFLFRRWGLVVIWGLEEIIREGYPICGDYDLVTETQENLLSFSVPWEETMGRQCSSPGRELSPDHAEILVLDFWFPKLWKGKFLLCKPPHLWYYVCGIQNWLRTHFGIEKWGAALINTLVFEYVYLYTEHVRRQLWKW